ncbi:MAG: type II secretion system F family protein [Planctomycetes bacterium]|nr:type II secretion system F family protein [Planctomycetota bacterium]
MPQFSYTAKKDDGGIVTGTMRADNERSLLDTLGRQGVFPLEVRQTSEEGAPRAAGRKSRRPVRAGDVGIFTQQLGDLLKAGVPLHRALTVLAEQGSNAEFSDAIGTVAKDIASGKPLHEALARFPRLFDRLYASMVKAGEAGGFLEDALHRLAGFMEKDEELKSRIRSAMAYPILLVVLGTGAVGFLMVFFIPRFGAIFESMKANLPWPTEVTMAASGFFRDYWMGVLALIALVPLLWARMRESPAGRRVIERVKITIPVFGDVAKKNAIARFARSLGTMLRSGVPILSSLAIAREAMGNVVLMQDIDEAGAGVKQGRSLAEILRRSRYFPAMTVDMIAVGEEAGNLENVLITIADSYDKQVDRAVRMFLSLFEPFLLVVMAAVVGFVVVSMLLPVFTLSSMIGR